VPIKNLSYGKVEAALAGTVRQRLTLQQGIPTDKAKEIVKAIKDAKIKVQASIQADQVRVSGKSRDDLQTVIQLLKGKEFGIELQFDNYRST
jgi:cyclic-di-GMP-binding protein